MKPGRARRQQTAAARARRQRQRRSLDQLERAALDPEAEQQRSRWQLLSDHIEQLKRAVTSQLRGGEGLRSGQRPLVVVDERERDVLSAALLHYRNMLAMSPGAFPSYDLLKEHIAIAWRLIERNEEPGDPVVRARLDRFVEAFTRWDALRDSPKNDKCPFCGELVIIKPGETSNDYLHREPACAPWMPALMALGAHSPRREECQECPACKHVATVPCGADDCPLGWLYQDGG